MRPALLHRTFRRLAPLLAVAAVWAGAGGLEGQVPPDDVELRLRDAELEHTVARSEWETALAAFRAAEARWQRALDEQALARESGDDSRYSEALGQSYRQALQLETQEAREQETARRLEDSRESLMGVLAESKDELYEEAMDADTSPQERTELTSLWMDRDNRYRELQAEAAPPTQVALVANPEINIDPRDGPQELDSKIKLLELWIREIDDGVQALDEEIDALQKEARQRRDLQDLMVNVERFDDTFVPVTSPDPLRLGDDEQESQGQSGEDGDIESLDDLSATEQIQALELLREQMFDRRQRLETKVESFRQRLLRMTTS